MADAMRRGVRCAGLVAALWLAGTGCVSHTVGESEQTDRQKAASVRDLGIDHLANGRDAMAIRELRRSLTLYEDDAETHHWLGEGYRRRGFLDKALAHPERSLALDGDIHEVRLDFSGLLIQLGDYERAIEQVDQLVDDPTYPRPWAAYTNKGFALYKLGRLSEARASFDEALQYNRRYWPAHLNLGILAKEAGQHMAALRHFERVLESRLGYNAEAETHYRMGEIYVSLGRRDEAVRHFTTALDGAPDGAWGQQSRDYLKLLR